MISTIIFSRDRACQLDLLLRSIRRFAPHISPVYVLFRATSSDYSIGYRIVKHEHPWVSWRNEKSFQEDARALLKRVTSELMMCMTDDSIILVSFDALEAAKLMHRSKDFLCFSLRLGLNTGYCYPLKREQAVPYFMRARDVLMWEWKRADGDFSYPGSLDAHIFRTDEFRLLLNARNFSNPNQMEDALMKGCKKSFQPLMASFTKSKVVSLPVNRVNETHPNRFGQLGASEPQELNDRFVSGERLLLDNLTKRQVNAAHVEMPLEFNEPH